MKAPSPTGGETTQPASSPNRGGVLLEALADAPLQLRVDLRDAALRDLEHLADLPERQVLHVQQHRELALAGREALERAPELRAGLLAGGLMLGIVLGVVRLDGLDEFDAAVGTSHGERRQRGEVRAPDLVLLLAELGAAHLHHGGQLGGGRRAPMRSHERLTRPREIALQAAQRARRPVAPPQLVEDRPVYARPEVRLQAGSLGRVIPVDRPDQRLDPARDQVVHLARRRQLADLPVDDVLDERHVGEHQPVA
jgi:hypothetical protein